MANAGILLKVYNEITGNNLDTSVFDNKVIMQKIVFLLSELRIFVDDYKFAWDNYGPFSQKLQNDINEITANDSFDSVMFDDEAMDKISFLKDLFDSNNSDYSQREWLEDVASYIYLKKYMYPQASWENITKKIESIKGYLSNTKANLLALEWCQKFFDYSLV